MKTALLGLVLAAAACSSPPSRGITTPPPDERVPIQVAPPVDAPIVLDAPVDAPVDAAPQAFRAFTAPAAMRLRPATPRGKSCRSTGPVDLAHEMQRELAALDASLREKGGMLLPTQQLDSMSGEPKRQGAVYRGANGERMMVVDIVGICNGSEILPVAVDANGDVYTVHIDPKPRTTRTVSLCEPVCGGCGTPPPPTMIVAEVPANAKFVGMRQVQFPIDVKVEFESNDAKGMPKRCQPRP